MDIELIRTLLTIARVLWIVMALLLVAAAVALLVRARARYGLLIASCSCAAAFSLAWIVLVRAADSFALGTVMDVLGPWVVLAVPRVVEPGIWPWIVLACSLAGIAFGVLGVRRTRAQLGPRI